MHVNFRLLVAAKKVVILEMTLSLTFSCNLIHEICPLLVDLDGLPPDLSIIKDFFFAQNKISEDYECF